MAGWIQMGSKGAAVRELVFRREQTAASEAAAETFDELYRKYWPRLVALCRRRANDDGLAEDIAQETLLRALVHLDELDAGRPLWPWLKTIATNLIIDHARKHSRVVTCEEHDDRPGEDEPSVEDAELLRQAIGALPGRQRAAVALRYINDWDSNEAAEWLGLTRPAYEQLLFRARRRLRTEYRRIAGDVLGGVSAGAAALRAATRRAAQRLREAVAAPVGELSTLSAAQLAGGALSLMVTLAAQPTPTLADAPAVAFRPVLDRASGRAPNRPSVGGGRGSSGGGRASTGGSGGGSAAASHGYVTHAGKPDLVPSITNENVQQPEDTHVTSVVLSPGFATDNTMFAAGRAPCPENLCSSVLFKSTDAGRTWRRLSARAFDGDEILLPPNFGDEDARIFAMGRTGLQVSGDGGESFAPAATTGPAYVVGSAAISPAFDQGDPSILIGSQTLMRYRDDTKTLEPVPFTTGAGPLDPKFSPQRPSDDRIVVGGLEFNTTTRSMVSAVHTCSGTVCNTALLDFDALPASVRLAPDFGVSDLAYAFTQWGAYASTDGAASFHRLLHFSSETFVQDLAIGRDGQLFLSAAGAEGGLYTSLDGGASWSRISDPAFEGGAGGITAEAGVVIASLHKTGFACSTDGGVTWAPRCAASASN